MVNEFSDATEAEAERYLLEDHMETALYTQYGEITPLKEQADPLRKTYLQHDDLILSALLFARLSLA